jgi:hypothetical protein
MFLTAKMEQRAIKTLWSTEVLRLDKDGSMPTAATGLFATSMLLVLGRCGGIYKAGPIYGDVIVMAEDHCNATLRLLLKYCISYGAQGILVCTHVIFHVHFNHLSINFACYMPGS